MDDKSSEKLDYYLSSLDELGETLINHDQTEEVGLAVLRLILGTVMAPKGALLLYDNKYQNKMKISASIHLIEHPFCHIT